MKVIENIDFQLIRLKIIAILLKSNECLEMLKCKDVNVWPNIKKNIIEEIKFAVQVNGKTRDIITLKTDLTEEDVNKEVLKKSKAKKFLDNEKIIKTIFIKNKIINYILKC